MEADSKGSVSRWLEGIRDGDSASAQKIWDRYFSELARVAHARLRHLSAEATGEDVALSALNSVMVGAREGRYADVADRQNLWPLLVTLTARKSITQIRRQLAKKRSVAAQVAFTDVEQYLGVEPSAEFAIEVAETLERLLTKLDDPNLRIIAQRKLEGFSHEEIAAELRCSPRTIIRKLNRVREEWQEYHREESEHDR